MRTRADLLLVARGLFESRAKARAAIEAGGVAADGRPVAIKFWHEVLPRNANGKIMKNELKKLFEDEPAKA